MFLSALSPLRTPTNQIANLNPARLQPRKTGPVGEEEINLQRSTPYKRPHKPLGKGSFQPHYKRAVKVIRNGCSVGYLLACLSYLACGPHT